MFKKFIFSVSISKNEIYRINATPFARFSSLKKSQARLYLSEYKYDTILFIKVPTYLSISIGLRRYFNRVVKKLSILS